MAKRYNWITKSKNKDLDNIGLTADEMKENIAEELAGELNRNHPGAYTIESYRFWTDAPVVYDTKTGKAVAYEILDV